MQKTARAFTTAWASHDTRPGRDTSFDDASRRAAAYADGDLAEELRTRTRGSAGGRQWMSWKDRQVQVTVTVVQVSLADGAPAPTEESGFARVIYRLTETPADGPATESEQHVALKLHRVADGSWRVVGLPNV
jgi:ketosteroid isomerase-like protein